ncbi:methyltransferase type 11 [Streptomyces humidus]|uniref:Methyltransferase type 11 n=2 Tax=Streptomyces humidus TaxID=52259 RepID=A0A918GAY0_9ACTN|nr:methyltransferase type 11 [Streptomyces humidus]
MYMASRIEADTELVARLYNSISWVFSSTWDDNFHFGYWESPDDQSSVAEATDRLTDLLIDALSVAEGDRVLDLGCGVGKPALRLHRRTGAEVLGVTVSESQVEEASARAAEAGATGAVRFELADAMALPYPDDSFDAVLALESMPYMERAVALKEMARVVRPGGRIALTDLLEPAPVDGVRWQAPDIQQVHRAIPLPKAEDYRELCAEAGVEVVQLRDITEQTSYGVPRWREEILRQREALVGDEAQLVERFGAEGAAIIKAMLAAPEKITEYGYVILVAQA